MYKYFIKPAEIYDPIILLLEITYYVILRDIIWLIFYSIFYLYSMNFLFCYLNHENTTDSLLFMNDPVPAVKSSVHLAVLWTNFLVFFLIQ